LKRWKWSEEGELHFFGRIAFLSIILICSLGAQENPYVHAEDSTQKILGPIDKFFEYGGESFSSLELKRKVLYDEIGNISEETAYGDMGVIKTVSSYSYEENTGRLIEIEGKNSEGVPIWKYQFVYDEEGHLSEEVSLNGQLEKEWCAIYGYSEEGLLEEKINYRSDGSINLQETYTYDDALLLIARTTLYSDGKLLKRVAYVYDEQGREIEEERYDANGLYETAEFFYSTLSSPVKEILHDRENQEKKRMIYVYNDRNLLLNKNTFFSDDRPNQKTSYVYDEKGNWVRRMDDSGLITIREIMYQD
jgi:hypothetical protein